MDIQLSPATSALYPQMAGSHADARQILRILYPTIRYVQIRMRGSYYVALDHKSALVPIQALAHGTDVVDNVQPTLYAAALFLCSGSSSR